MIKTLGLRNAKTTIRCFHGNLPDELFPSRVAFLAEIHKCCAIPLEEIALSFL
jgi:hypothetical protein